jgi:hypothetical protein
MINHEMRHIAPWGNVRHQYVFLFIIPPEIVLDLFDKTNN